MQARAGQRAAPEREKSKQRLLDSWLPVRAARHSGAVYRSCRSFLRTQDGGRAWKRHSSSTCLWSIDGEHRMSFHWLRSSFYGWDMSACPDQLYQFLLPRKSSSGLILILIWKRSWINMRRPGLHLYQPQIMVSEISFPWAAET